MQCYANGGAGTGDATGIKPDHTCSRSAATTSTSSTGFSVRHRPVHGWRRVSESVTVVHPVRTCVRVSDSLPSRVASFAGLDIFVPENKPVRSRSQCVGDRTRCPTCILTIDSRNLRWAARIVCGERGRTWTRSTATKTPRTTRYALLGGVSVPCNVCFVTTHTCERGGGE
jgi:hypothetical protein